MNLNHLLRPKSVAIVGATEKPGFGRDSCLNMLGSGLGDKLFFVNPRREQVFGKKCFRSISDIGQQVEMVIVCTPQNTVNGIIEEAGQCGCKGAVIYASGYSETGEEGKMVQKELVEVATKYGIAVCGPNCAGFINNVDNVPAFGLPLTSIGKKGNIGLVAQSGQVCSLLVNVEHLNFAYAISSGNNAVVQMEDYLEFLIKDENTNVVALYLEGIRNPNRFSQILAEAAEMRKPIITLKVGASEKARQTATAHTGSLAGSDAAYSALFNKFGVIRVHDMEELVNVCLLMSTLKKKPKATSYAMLNLSGGEAAISADLADLHGINLANFTDKTLENLKKILPPYATPNNPLDTTATLAHDHENYRAALKTVMKDPGVGMVIMGLNIPEVITDANKTVQCGLGNCVVEVAKDLHSKPTVVMPAIAGKRALELRDLYSSGDVPILSSPHYALEAIKKYSEFCCYDPSERLLKIAIKKTKDSYREKVTPETLSEHESKLLLKKYGIPVPEEYVTETQEQALDAARRIGYPLVLKIDSPDIPHKTDVGGVKLGIRDDESLIRAFNEIKDNIKRHKPDSKINGVLVQKMLPQAMEVIVGVKRDHQFGPMVLVGLGGIFVEIFKDVAVYPAPLNKKEALKMIQSLKAYPLFKGYRGAEPLDVDQLSETIIKVGDLAVDNLNEISELDINPLFVYTEKNGVCAADALIVKG